MVNRLVSQTIIVLVLIMCCLRPTGVAAQQAPLDANRTVTCAELLLDAASPPPPAAIVIPLPPASPGSGAVLIATCTDSALDGRNVSFAASPGARLVLDGWRQLSGSVEIAPAAPAKDLVDVRVTVTGTTAVEVGRMSQLPVYAHAVSLIARHGSVRDVRLSVLPGVQLSCAAECHGGLGGSCTAGSAVATLNASMVELDVHRGAVVKATVEGPCTGTAGAAAGSVVVWGSAIEDSVLRCHGSDVSAAVMSGSSATGWAVAAGFATFESRVVLFTNVSSTMEDGTAVAARARAMGDSSTTTTLSFGHVAAGGVLPVDASDVRVVDATLQCRGSTLNGSIAASRGAVAVAGVAALGQDQTLIVDSRGSHFEATDCLITLYRTGDAAAALAAVGTAAAAFQSVRVDIAESTLAHTGSHTNATAEGMGTAVAAVGLATSSRGWNSLGANSTAMVAGLSVVVQGGSVSANAASDGCSTAAGGVATTSRSFDAGRTARTISQTTARRAMLTAMNTTLSARSGSEGCSAAAAGFATATRVWTSNGGKRSDCETLVSDTSITLTGSKANAVVDGHGSAAAVAGFATGSRSTGAADSAVSVNRTTVTVAGSSVTSAVSGDYGSAAAVLGLATGSESSKDTECVVALADSTFLGSASDIVASTASHGSSAAAGGVATGSYAGKQGAHNSRSSTTVANATVTVTGGIADASAGSDGSAAAAVGVATASRSYSTTMSTGGSSHSSAVVNSTTIEASNASVSATVSMEGTAAAAVGIAAASRIWTRAPARGTVHGLFSSAVSLSAATVAASRSNAIASAGANAAAAAAVGVAVSGYGKGNAALTFEGRECSFTSWSSEDNHHRVAALADGIGSAAAAVGIAVGGSSRENQVPSDAQLYASRLVAVGTNTSASAVGDSSAAAAVGVATAGYSKGTRADMQNTAIVDHCVLMLINGSSTVDAPRVGAAAAAVGLAIGASNDDRAVSMQARVAWTTIAASGSTVSAAAKSYGCAVATVGIAVASYTGAAGGRSSTLIEHSTLLATNTAAAAAVEALGSSAAAVGIASSSSFGPSARDTAVTVHNVTVAAAATAAKATAGWDGTAAAAIGVATAQNTRGSGSVGTSTVDRTLIVARDCNASATAMTAGTAAVAVGVATASRSAGSDGTATTTVTESTVAADGHGQLEAIGGSNGGAVAAVGIASAVKVFSYTALSDATVNGTRIMARLANVSVSSGDQGCAAAAVGVAAGVNTGNSNNREASVKVNSTDIAALGSNVSVVAGLDGSAAAAVGIAAGGPAIGSSLGIAEWLSLRLCQSSVSRRAPATGAAFSMVTSGCTHVKDTAQVKHTAFDSTIELPTAGLFGGPLHVIPGLRHVWLDRLRVEAPDSTCLDVPDASCERPAAGPSISALDSALSCGTGVGWGDASVTLDASVTSVGSTLRGAAGDVDLATAFPGASFGSPDAVAPRREAEQARACAPVVLPPYPLLPEYDLNAAPSGDDTGGAPQSTTRTPSHPRSETMPLTATAAKSRTVADSGGQDDEEPTPVPTTDPPPVPERPGSATASHGREGGDTTDGPAAAEHTMTVPPSSSAGGPAATRSATPTAEVNTDDVASVQRSSVPPAMRAASTATATVAVLAVTALAPGALQPGAVGAPARFSALSQIRLCTQVEDPQLTELPWRPVATRDDSLMTQLAERAVAAALVCGLLAVCAALWLRHGPSGLPLAAFIVPAGYVGPLVTGVATQLVSFAAQPDLEPLDAESGEPLDRPTGANVVTACIGACVLWVHLALVARIVFGHESSTATSSPRDSTMSGRIYSVLGDFLCGGLRDSQRRGACGFAASDDSTTSRQTADEATTIAMSGEVAPSPPPAKAPSRWLRAVVLVEIGTAHAFELLVGLRGTHAACVARAVAAVATALGFVGYVGFVQPLASRAEHGFQLGLAVLQAAAAALLGYGLASDGAAEAAEDAGEWAATAGLWLVVVQAVSLAVVEACGLSSAAADDVIKATAAEDDGSQPLLAVPTPDDGGGSGGGGGASSRIAVDDGGRERKPPSRVAPDTNKEMVDVSNPLGMAQRR